MEEHRGKKITNMILSFVFYFSQAARKVPEGRAAVMLENITWQVSMESKQQQKKSSLTFAGISCNF